MSIILALILSAFPAQTVPPNLDSWAQHVFIGQVYPSGNVYLRSFAEEPPVSWPVMLSVIPIGDGQRNVSQVVRANFVRALEDASYIPGVEGMDEDHSACGTATFRKSDPAHQQLSGDFFSSMFDHCEPNDGFALYRAAPSNYSALVVAFDSSLMTANPRVMTDSAPRPVTAAEQQEIDRRKRELVGQECTTEPAYRDSAVPIFQSALQGTDLTLRLSTFETPGCAGHFARVFILDVLKDGQSLRTFEISRGAGVL